MRKCHYIWTCYDPLKSWTVTTGLCDSKNQKKQSYLGY